MKTSLSVLVPVYNEEHLVYTSLDRLKLLDTSPHLERVEVIVVDDCSKDETPQVIERFKLEQTGTPDSKIKWIFLRHDNNKGKGQAVKTALERATCEISVIHDADLEYHPKDLLRIIRVFVEEEADAVYGSRFAGSEVRRVLFFRHELGNKFLTFLSNLVTNLNLTDMETCYKAVRTALLKSIPIESNDFRIEPELTIKLAKRSARIFEVPINYFGRTYAEGKKINWRDGLRALFAIVKFAVSARIYLPDMHESYVRARFWHVPRFSSWIADMIRKYCGNRVLEIGSCEGNLALKLLPRDRYVACETNPLYLRTLEALKSERPYLEVSYCDVMEMSSFPPTEEGYDTVICLNVLQHVNDDRVAISNIKNALAIRGTAIVMVPQGDRSFATSDQGKAQPSRYGKESFRGLAESCGFAVRDILEFNRIGTVAKFINGKILFRRSFNGFQLWVLNVLTPVFRAIDRFLPFRAESLIAILERRDDHGSDGKVYTLNVPSEYMEHSEQI
jgi:glycosyltransferase involved in cell wall biosynthesis